MNRIEAKIAELQQKKEKAHILYIMAGLPDFAKMKEEIRAQEAAGVPFVEIGIPFSDPVADGPAVQEASYRAICQGVNLKKTLSAVKELRADGCKMPLVFVMYYNTVLHFGVEAFVAACVENGVDGLVIQDLPSVEQDEIEAFLGKENAPVLMNTVVTGEVVFHTF